MAAAAGSRERGVSMFRVTTRNSLPPLLLVPSIVTRRVRQRTLARALFGRRAGQCAGASLNAAWGATVVWACLAAIIAVGVQIHDFFGGPPATMLSIIVAGITPTSMLAWLNFNVDVLKLVLCTFDFFFMFGNLCLYNAACVSIYPSRGHVLLRLVLSFLLAPVFGLGDALPENIRRKFVLSTVSASSIYFLYTIYQLSVMNRTPLGGEPHHFRIGSNITFTDVDVCVQALANVVAFSGRYIIVAFVGRGRFLTIPTARLKVTPHVEVRRSPFAHTSSIAAPQRLTIKPAAAGLVTSPDTPSLGSPVNHRGKYGVISPAGGDVGGIAVASTLPSPAAAAGRGRKNNGLNSNTVTIVPSVTRKTDADLRLSSATSASSSADDLSTVVAPLPRPGYDGAEASSDLGAPTSARGMNRPHRSSPARMTPKLAKFFGQSVSERKGKVKLRRANNSQFFRTYGHQNLSVTVAASVASYAVPQDSLADVIAGTSFARHVRTTLERHGLGLTILTFAMISLWFVLEDIGMDRLIVTILTTGMSAPLCVLVYLSLNVHIVSRLIRRFEPLWIALQYVIFRLAYVSAYGWPKWEVIVTAANILMALPLFGLSDALPEKIRVSFQRLAYTLGTMYFTSQLTAFCLGLLDDGFTEVHTYVAFANITVSDTSLITSSLTNLALFCARFAYESWRHPSSLVMLPCQLKVSVHLKLGRIELADRSKKRDMAGGGRLNGGPKIDDHGQRDDGDGNSNRRCDVPSAPTNRSRDGEISIEPDHHEIDQSTLPASPPAGEITSTDAVDFSEWAQSRRESARKKRKKASILRGMSSGRHRSYSTGGTADEHEIAAGEGCSVEKKKKRAGSSSNHEESRDSDKSSLLKSMPSLQSWSSEGEEEEEEGSGQQREPSG